MRTGADCPKAIRKDGQIRAGSRVGAVREGDHMCDMVVTPDQRWAHLVELARGVGAADTSDDGCEYLSAELLRGVL